ncbi:MAG TPA: ribosome biogenesis GTP-binding protein YihA/YsxC, partial [Syntrophales bacterium]|nr:ribosome biogenesis GTP-binding protein YihA/YsxC [Syntrophales bacterium]
MKITEAEFVKSAVQPRHYPDTSFPEVAFAGRSNVGKSSLINALTGRRRLAQTSNTPGRTRAINFFLLNNKLSFVDLPGYGYARVPMEMKKNWRPMVESYLKIRDNLRLVIVILDIRRDPAEGDLDLLEWLKAYAVAHAIVLTKSDKISKSEARVREDRIRAALGDYGTGPVIRFSAKTGEGKERVWGLIREAIPVQSSEFRVKKRASRISSPKWIGIRTDFSG